MTDITQALDRTTRLRQHPDPVASVLWNPLDTPKNVRDLCHAVPAELDVGEAACVSDAQSVLQGRRDDALIERAAD